VIKGSLCTELVPSEAKETSVFRKGAKMLNNRSSFKVLLALLPTWADLIAIHVDVQVVFCHFQHNKQTFF